MKLHHLLIALTYIGFLFLSKSSYAQDPPDISLIFYLDENSPAGTLVGTVNATDPDGDPLTFSIASGNESAAFAIGEDSGNITVNDETQLDFESTPSFNLMVEADDGNGGITTAGITINLNDIDENVLGKSVDLSVRIFPNPASDYLRIDFAGNQFEMIELVSVSGQPVRSQLVRSSSSELRLVGLKPGVYFLQLIDVNQSIIQQRVVKL